MRSMADPLAEEVARVAAQYERSQADAGRTWPAFVGTFLANVSLALVPLFPGSERVLGPMSVQESLACVTPGLVVMTIAFALYRLRGPEARLYRVVAEAEEVALQGFLLGLVLCADTVASIVWCATPISGLHRGSLRPRRPLYACFLSGLTHVPLALWFLLQGRPGEAAFVVCAWGAYGVVVFATSRATMRVITVEANANLASARLARAREDARKHDFDATLERHLGDGLRELLDELMDYDARSDSSEALYHHANAALGELERAVTNLGASDAPSVRGDLVAELERKCRAILPVGFELAIDYGAEGRDAAVAPRVSLATLRVARELTRNAEAHGAARRVRVQVSFHDVLEMLVSDDGSGVTPEAWQRAGGGLKNARVWASMLGGSFELDVSRRPWSTTMRWQVPAAGAEL